jgi:hypothetical protein
MRKYDSERLSTLPKGILVSGRAKPGPFFTKAGDLLTVLCWPAQPDPARALISFRVKKLGDVRAGN